ncbi:hypothetical protein QAD02_015649 [Eretmocerus hayati]|uniref:Uncharacterized protein n=1 Tax=Eretmocerus hayati TaxID=131215 RepID=A0ACC2P8U3_9HYME|nr:hypothetical protein QAD02_015649 [Eretmocerus hayati]
MASDEKWYFTKEQLANTPSRKNGINADKELSYRQQAANFIQDMGQRLMVSQLCINTAIVYMHRFYVFHSLTQFHRNSIATAALFLAAKVEEQPRKLEHVIKVAHMCLHRDAPALDPKSEQYQEQAQDLVFNENVLLQTLGFDVAIDHPHTHVVRCCHLVKASKDLAQTSYFMASNSLHLTTMCLQYKPTVVACFCIHLACKWSNWEIPQSNEGKYWFWYVDKTVTTELLAQLTGEFLHIFDKCPSRLKRKINSISASQSPNMPHPSTSSTLFETEPRKLSPSHPDAISLNFPSSSSRSTDSESSVKKSSSSLSGRASVDYREYREKKERERLDREKAASTSSSSLNSDPNKHHSHHHKPGSTSLPNKHSSSSSSSNMKQPAHHNHHQNSRQDAKNVMAQRHSGITSSSNSNQSRDRQRMSRDFNSCNTSGSLSHNHLLDSSLDVSINNYAQESSTIHPPEKLSNMTHKSHESRGADTRHTKQPSQQQKDAKPYVKYADQSRTSRKPLDILEQRSEEVRKIIEKPLPPPKPRAEVIKEEFAAMMLKQPHQPSKYEKPPVPSVNMSQPSSLPNESKMNLLNVGQTAFSIEKSPNAPVSAAQMSHKSMSASSKSNQLMPVKNGSSSSTSSFSLLGNLDDPKSEKRPRHPNERDSQALQAPPPTHKHRSLFSPEKTLTPTPKESLHSQRPKPKQKTSPAVPKLDSMSGQTNSSIGLMSDQKHKTSNNLNPTGFPSQKSREAVENLDSRQQLSDTHAREFSSSFGVHEQFGFGGSRTLDSVQQSKDGKGAGIKSPMELGKSFDGSSDSSFRHDQQHGLSNGLDFAKHEFSTIDPSSFIVKDQPPEQLFSHEMPSSDTMFMRQESQAKVSDFLLFETKKDSKETSLTSMKPERYSPLKSAQSISALLHEPLAPMPSLLQMSNYDKTRQQQSTDDEKQSPDQFHRGKSSESSLPSTVDLSDLGVSSILSSSFSQSSTTATSSASMLAGSITASSVLPATTEEKQKSEHRSKAGTSDSLPAVPIKITIPKDKLNLSSESIGTSSSSSAPTSVPSSSLKIKIPKERLKVTEVSSHQSSQQQQASQVNVTQAPLKIKIRTDGLGRGGSNADGSQALMSQQNQDISRKRERLSDGSDVVNAVCQD